MRSFLSIFSIVFFSLRFHEFFIFSQIQYSLSVKILEVFTAASKQQLRRYQLHLYAAIPNCKALWLDCKHTTKLKNLLSPLPSFEKLTSSIFHKTSIANSPYKTNLLTREKLGRNPQTGRRAICSYNHKSTYVWNHACKPFKVHPIQSYNW